MSVREAGSSAPSPSLDLSNSTHEMCKLASMQGQKSSPARSTAAAGEDEELPVRKRSTLCALT